MGDFSDSTHQHNMSSEPEHWGEQEWNSHEQEHWDEQEWDSSEQEYYPWDVLFETDYICYPVSSEKENLENGGRIIMPPSALDLLMTMNIEYPMLFELRTPSAERVTHCGVLEFTADLGTIIMPKWMMENMRLEEGKTVIVKYTQVPRGTYVKLQPHTKNFWDISNPKSILEVSLRSYACLTTGDTIMIAYRGKKYYLDVVETKPSHAISIIDTDCEVDFTQPLDYKEPEKQLPSVSPSPDKELTKVHDDTVTKTTPFTGYARRLDGKSCTQSVEETSPSMVKQQQTENETKNSNSKPSSTASRRTSGKLVFGSDVNASKIQTPPKASLKSTTEELSQKEEKPKFQAFTGKKYSLID